MLNGVFAVWKRSGPSSYDQVKLVQKLLTRQFNTDLKVGHGGTLDPLAEGILVIGVGRGCKLLRHFLDADKRYTVTAKLGEYTESLDRETEVTQTKPFRHITQAMLDLSYKRFTGKTLQKPPVYSAVKINGVKSYNLARAGEHSPVEFRAKPVLIHRLEQIEWVEDELTLQVDCSKGTFIRSLVHDIAESVGSTAHSKKLVRNRIGCFGWEECLDTESLTSKGIIEACQRDVSRHLLSLQTSQTEDHEVVAAKTSNVKRGSSKAQWRPVSWRR